MVSEETEAEAEAATRKAAAEGAKAIKNETAANAEEESNAHVAQVEVAEEQVMEHAWASEPPAAAGGRPS